MQFINGITLLLIYQLVGEISVLLLGIPVPGPVLGMIMLLITLMLRRKVDDSLDQSVTALLSHLSLLFVPAGVGLMVHFQRISDEWLCRSRYGKRLPGPQGDGSFLRPGHGPVGFSDGCPAAMVIDSHGFHQLSTPP